VAWEVWYIMIRDGFTINKCDKYVYTKIIRNTCINVCLYVDDMLIFRTNIRVIKSTKKMLCNNFDMKNLGVADVILEIKITRLDKISLSQSDFVDKMIERFKEYGIKGNTNYFSHISTFTRIQELKSDSWSILKSSKV